MSVVAMFAKVLVVTPLPSTACAKPLLQTQVVEPAAVACELAGQATQVAAEAGRKVAGWCGWVLMRLGAEHLRRSLHRAAPVVAALLTAVAKGGDRAAGDVLAPARQALAATE